jgi:hypothetical protein
LAACTSVHSGNVGIRTAWGGRVELEELAPGMRASLSSSVEEASTKEITIPLTDLRPKAADNLSLQDLDVTVSYIPNSTQIAEFMTSHAGQSNVDNDGVVLPGTVLVHSIASSTVADEVSKLNSLTMHTQRSLLEANVMRELQKELNIQVPNFFRVTRVVVTNLNTDPSIEASIRKVVQNEKELEAMTSKEAIAQKAAEIRVVEAHGIADANAVINHSLTPEYLQHETNQALMAFAVNGGSKTIVIPANIPTTPLINTN